MITVKEFDDKKKWASFLEENDIAYYPLFQSWEWGEVQALLGFPIIHLGIFDKDVLVGVCLVVDIAARRGHYLHLRHGPVIPSRKKAYLDALVSFVTTLAKQKGASFVRMSPLWEKETTDIQLFKKYGCLPAPIHNMDAELCWVLDITPTEDDILSQMRKSHRYLIRKAQKMDITITQTTDPAAVADFLPLYADVSQRKHFVPHRGIREELTVFGKENKAALFLAKYNNEVAGGILIDFVGKMAVYHHGATLSKYRDVPLSNILLWEAIKEAKKRGMHLFNFWGIAPEEQKDHPWQGHSLFKKGFGGYQKEFIHAQDLPLSVMYWKSWVIEQISKKRKGY